MTPQVPPPAATWLLTHVCRRPTGGELAGDLLEEYQRNRGAFWYWKQVVVAMALSVWQDGVAHKGLALRSVILGTLIVSASLNAVTTPLLNEVHRLFVLETGFLSWHEWNGYGGYVLVPLWAVTGLCTGWVLAWTHRAIWCTALLANIAVFLVATNAALWQLLASTPDFRRYRATLLLYPWFEGAIVMGIVLGGLMWAAKTPFRGDTAHGGA